MVYEALNRKLSVAEDDSGNLTKEESKCGSGSLLYFFPDISGFKKLSKEAQEA